MASANRGAAFVLCGSREACSPEEKESSSFSHGRDEIMTKIWPFAKRFGVEGSPERILGQCGESCN
jgi:hypothetical protein